MEKDKDNAFEAKDSEDGNGKGGRKIFAEKGHGCNR